VGSERNDEDLHLGRGQWPKISLAGYLDGMLDRRPVRLIFDRSSITLRVHGVSTIFALRKIWRGCGPSLIEILKLAKIKLLIQAGRLVTLEVYPRPNALVERFIPKG
jgi:hypothetical protein